MRLTKKQRDVILGKSGGRCWYCGCELPLKGWHADHIEPIIRKTEFMPNPNVYLSSYSFRKTGESFRPENDCIENIVPACAPCNLFKSTFPLEGFREEIDAQRDRLPKSSSAFRIAQRFGIIEIKNIPVRFWFEDNQ